MPKRLATVKKQVTWPVKAKVSNEIIYVDASDEKSAVIAGASNEVDKDGYFVEERVSARNRLVAGEVDANEVTHIDASDKQIAGTSAGLIPFIEKDYVLRSPYWIEPTATGCTATSPRSTNRGFRT